MTGRTFELEAADAEALTTRCAGLELLVSFLIDQLREANPEAVEKLERDIEAAVERAQEDGREQEAQLLEAAMEILQWGSGVEL